MSEQALSAADLAAAGLDLLTRGKLAVAQGLVLRALAAAEDEPQVWRLAAEVARTAGKLDEARAAAARWQRLAPADAEAAAVLAALSEQPAPAHYAGLKPVPFVLLDGFLPPERHAESVDWLMENVADLTEAKVVKTGGERMLDGDARSARVGFEPRTIKAWLQPMIAALVPRCIAVFGLEPFAPERFELHVTASYHGDFYIAHRDYVPEDDDAAIQTRRISYVYYFRPPGGVFAGGELRLYDWQGEKGAATRQRFTTILPLDNRLVLFPSHALHEVCPVQAPSGRVEDGRFTLNGWVHRAKG